VVKSTEKVSHKGDWGKLLETDLRKKGKFVKKMETKEIRKNFLPREFFPGFC